MAELANLELTADEEPLLLQDLNAILEYVAQMSELDTSSVEPMAQVGDIAADQHLAASALRQDIPEPCLDRALVMKSAPDSDGVFFRVPKVIER